MEDYHFAEYRTKKDRVLGLFAIFDGHLGDRVPSYLKENLFNNILEEVCMFRLSVCSFLFCLYFWIIPFLCWHFLAFDIVG